jgi:putative membrane protein
MSHPASAPIVGLVVHMLVTAVSILLVGKVLPGVTVKSYGSAVVFAVVVAILNGLLWHFLHIGTSDASHLLTAGAGSIILNAILFLVADKIATGVQISGCIMALIAAFCVSLVNGVLSAVISHL